MSAKALLGLTCLLLLLPLKSHAHMNPHGDISPEVEVEDGKFAIHFVTRVETGSLDWRMLFTPEGKLVLPRHRILAKRPNPPELAGTSRVEIRNESVSNRARFVLTRTRNGQTAEQPLPLDPVKFPMIADSTQAGGWAGFTWSSYSHEWPGPQGVCPPPTISLFFSTAATQGFTPGKTVLIGDPATIYEFPIASAPVWAARRWWVAWVRKAQTAAERKDPLRRWETILTSIDPVSGKMNNKRLPGLSHWNTTVSMKTTRGWLCIAWNATIDGSYPGVAKIVTAFEKLPAD